MIRSIEIENFRGIKQGKLSGFTPLVVLTGPNNSGKSTVLDALSVSTHEHGFHAIGNRRRGLDQIKWLLFTEGGGPPGMARLLVRTDSTFERFVYIFHSDLNRNSLTTSSSYSDVDEASLKNNNVGNVPPPTDIPSTTLIDSEYPRSPLPQLYTLVARRGLLDEAKSIIKELIPELVNLEILVPENEPIIGLTYKNGALPLLCAGDGVRVLVQQCLELAAPAGGVVLIEEPEVHMHPRAIHLSAKAILAAVSRGIQIFITTHSLELIDSLLSQANEKQLKDLSFQRLQLTNGMLAASCLSGEDADLARSQIQDDLR